MIQFKLNGKKLQVASSWYDLTFDQYLKVFELKDDILQAVSLASGIDYEILKTSKIEGVESVIQAVSFLTKPAKFEGIVDKCGPYKLPKDFNIQFESLGQFEDMRQIMKVVDFKNPKDVALSYQKYVAIYLQAIRDGEYDPVKAIEMQEEVGKYPAHQVVVLGSFFLLKLTSLLNGTTKTSQSTPQSQKKSKQVSKSSAKRSGRSARSRR